MWGCPRLCVGLCINLQTAAMNPLPLSLYPSASLALSHLAVFSLLFTTAAFVPVPPFPCSTARDIAPPPPPPMVERERGLLRSRILPSDSESGPSLLFASFSPQLRGVELTTATWRKRMSFIKFRRKQHGLSKKSIAYLKFS